MKNNTNKKSSIKKVSLGILTILSLTALGGTALHYSFSNNNFINSSLIDSIKQNGIKIKLLNSTTENGYITNTYNFTITPANATNQNVTAIASYVDGSTYDNIVEVTVDNNSKTISLKTSETTGFEKQIKIIIAAEENPNIKAEILVDFMKKINNLNLSKNFIPVGTNENNTKDFFVNQYLNIDYSKYTIDQNFDFNIDITSIYNVNICQTLDQGNYNDLEPYKQILADYYINNMFNITTAGIWNACDENDYHSVLKDISGDEDAWIEIVVDEMVIDVTSEDGNIKSFYFGKKHENNVSFNFGFYDDYSTADFTVNVDSISLETSKVIF